MEDKIVCPECKGRGLVPDEPLTRDGRKIDRAKKCSLCQGNKEVHWEAFVGYIRRKKSQRG